jgi:hypothetical protein
MSDDEDSPLVRQRLSDRRRLSEERRASEARAQLRSLVDDRTGRLSDESSDASEEESSHAPRNKAPAIPSTGAIAILFESTTPAPIVVYLRNRLVALGAHVERSGAHLLLVRLPDALLEETAELVGMEKKLLPGVNRSWSESLHPMRTFRVASRSSFVVGRKLPLTPAEVATLVYAWFDRHLVADATWPAALIAAGRADAVRTAHRTPNPT